MMMVMIFTWWLVKMMMYADHGDGHGDDMVMISTWWLVKAVLDFLFFFGGCLFAKFNWARSRSESIFVILFHFYAFIYVTILALQFGVMPVRNV